MSLTTDTNDLLAKLNNVKFVSEAIINNYPVVFVDHLIGNGGYINTNYIPTNNTKYEIILSNAINSETGIFGADTAYNQRQTLFIIQGGEYRWYYTAGYANITNLTKKQKIGLYRGSVWVDDVQKVNNTTIYTTPTVPVWIFRCHTANIAKFYLYDFKIYENNVLTRHYRPAVNLQGRVGLFEVVTKTFFDTANGVDFLYG